MNGRSGGQKGSAQDGFSLIELMVVVGLIGVLSAIALPLYNGYVQTGREGALLNNISTIEVFEEDFRLRNGVYSAGNYDVAGGDTTLSDATNIAWTPRTNDGTVYAVTLVGTTGYKVNATDTVGTTVCMDFPGKTKC